uniref:Uncharacterized protein n=1 Tax=viral metagenome TaxID=1070528 RepID=A0A6M3J282_9ZZZZ
MKLLLVTWIDSSRSYDNFTEEQLREYENIEMQTVGWGEVLDDRIVMSPEKEGNNYRIAFTVPKVCVTKIEELIIGNP